VVDSGGRLPGPTVEPKAVEEAWRDETDEEEVWREGGIPVDGGLI